MLSVGRCGVAKLQMKFGHMDGMHCIIDGTTVLVKIKSVALYNCQTVVTFHKACNFNMHHHQNPVTCRGAQTIRCPSQHVQAVEEDYRSSEHDKRVQAGAQSASVNTINHLTGSQHINNKPHSISIYITSCGRDSSVGIANH